MALSTQDVERLAHLARIDITPVEAAEVGQKLDCILDLIGQLRAVETSGIVPMSHAQDVSLPLREDIVTESDQHELFQESAPAIAHGLYLVPQVIE
jgi:aspartyl-tRNA(Asn)/glutamyl-tRNA(Gln) amidotransferase subunit C